MIKANGKPLRFAALIRVSTERQEKQGESLRTQQTQIEAAVKQLGGEIVRRYAGQEHATSGWEREQRDKMLAEAQQHRKPFDAVIVAHEDRWSRDDTRSGADLEKLQQADIRFFVLNREQDLSDPSARMYLGMSAVIGAYHARNQSKKSIENRIERAKRNIPTGGTLPFGRTFDKATGKWGIDEDKHAMIRDVAERYLAGESLGKLAEEHGVNYSNLTVTLRERCGDTYALNFRDDRLNIDETVTLQVPRLLPEKTIRALQQRLEANRTYMHGSPKYDYLLGGRIFCETCGFSLTGVFDNGIRYYRHNLRSDKCPLRPRPLVRADAIEPAVVRDLFNMFGNAAAIERAVKDGTPDRSQAMKRRDRVQVEIGKIVTARNRILTYVEKDTITDEQAEARLRDLKERESVLQIELDNLFAELADVPDADTVRSMALHVQEVCGGIWIEDEAGNTYAGGNDVQSCIMMNDADRKALIATALAGNLPNGKPAGVYLTPTGGEQYGRKHFRYVIKGLLCGSIKGATRFAGPTPDQSRAIEPVQATPPD